MLSMNNTLNITFNFVNIYGVNYITYIFKNNTNQIILPYYLIENMPLLFPNNSFSGIILDDKINLNDYDKIYNTIINDKHLFLTHYPNINLIFNINRFDNKKTQYKYK